MSDKFPLEAIQAMMNRLEDKMEQRFSRVDERLERMDDKIDAVAKTADKNTVVLEEHQRRALANEKHAHLLEEQLKVNAAAQAEALQKSEEKQDGKVKELAESVELFVKFPKHLYKIAIWLSAIAAGAGALTVLARLALRHMAQ